MATQLKWLSGTLLALALVLLAAWLTFSLAHRPQDATQIMTADQAAGAIATGQEVQTLPSRQSGGRDEVPELIEKIAELAPDNHAGLDLAPDTPLDLLKQLTSHFPPEPSPPTPADDEQESLETALTAAEDIAAADQDAAQSLALAFLATQTTAPIRFISVALAKHNDQWMVQYVHDDPQWAMPPTGYPTLWVDRKTGKVTTTAEEAGKTGKKL